MYNACLCSEDNWIDMFDSTVHMGGEGGGGGGFLRYLYNKFTPEMSL
jgi:hypothetical protein